MSRYAILLLRDAYNKYSVNAITAVLDRIPDLDVYLVEKIEYLLPVITSLKDKYGKRLIIAMSLQTIMLVDDEYLGTVIELNNYAKKHRLVSVVGGPHATGDPLGSIISLGFQYAVIGEGEETIRELVEALMNSDDPLKVKGIYTIVDGKPVYTGRRKPVNLDNYPPFPYWRYIYGPIEISRGCFYGCKYCQVSYMHGFYMRHRSIDNIVYYAGVMVRNGFRDIRFISPDSLAYGLKKQSREPRLDLVEQLLDELYSRYVKDYKARIFYGTFPSEVRPEHLTFEAARILRRYVSNKEIILGAQTGSNRLLKIIGRGHTIEDVYNAVEAAKRYGFRPSVDYIFGLPGETEEDLWETIKSIEKLVDMGARIHLHVFLPLPGTPYAYKAPGKVPFWVKRKIAKIIGRGAGYGQWQHQERIALKIAELRRRGIILPRADQFSARLHQRSVPP